MHQKRWENTNLDDCLTLIHKDAQKNDQYLQQSINCQLLRLPLYPVLPSPPSNVKFPAIGLRDPGQNWMLTRSLRLRGKPLPSSQASLSNHDQHQPIVINTFGLLFSCHFRASEEHRREERREKGEGRKPLAD